MTGRLREKPRPMFDRPALGIVGTVEDPAQTRMRNRAGAHRAWLQGDPKIAVAKPVTPKCDGRRTYGEDFGMRGRIT